MRKMIFKNKNKIEYSLIAAITPDSTIGQNAKIPWHIPEDFKLFKQKTLNSTIIMGQKTWDSLPIKPLHKRTNIVLTRNPQNKEKNNQQGAKTFSNLNDAFTYAATQNQKIFVIGGAEIYNQTIQHATHLYISHVKKEYNGNIKFPTFNPEKYELIKQQNFEQFTFKQYKKCEKK